MTLFESGRTRRRTALGRRLTRSLKLTATATERPPLAAQCLTTAPPTSSVSPSSAVLYGKLTSRLRTTVPPTLNVRHESTRGADG